ncbi:unnamed protein product [Cyprideis torosa]|uniref:Uncharacterized protein n=1 Tax=Cyprideis torosa TaxID=163714 RepID=A0A7R8W981_9CRUS|nr:unnamed protein product [Cyprideis torosa]CAG0889465.1 unnamed protein product [Cyprideis torosa]
MPELPEVEVIRRGLKPHLIGKQVKGFSWSGKQLRRPVPEEAIRKNLVDARITSIGRRAKYILLGLDSGATVLLHLGMTGRLGIFAKGTPAERHDHLFFLLDNRLELRFNDTRRFGQILLLPTAKEVASYFEHDGPEPLSKACTSSHLHGRARRCRQPIKNFIMNGKNIAGVGNIYANETLFAAAIHPLTSANSLTLQQWSCLLDNLRQILRQAISCGGSTIRDFIDSSGRSGYFQVNFKVYDRGGLPCVRCQDTLVKTVLAGRASFFCPSCQKREET